MHPNFIAGCPIFSKSVWFPGKCDSSTILIWDRYRKYKWQQKSLETLLVPNTASSANWRGATAVNIVGTSVPFSNTVTLLFRIQPISITGRTCRLWFIAPSTITTRWEVPTTAVISSTSRGAIHWGWGRCHRGGCHRGASQRWTRAGTRGWRRSRQWRRIWWRHWSSTTPLPAALQTIRLTLVAPLNTVNVIAIANRFWMWWRKETWKGKNTVGEEEENNYLCILPLVQ